MRTIGLLKDEQKFDVTGFKFKYRLDAYSCYRRRTGKCSLDFPFDNLNYNELISHDEGSFDYCRSLYLYMKDNPIGEISISEFSCGHYSFSDGQHRACIAKKMGILVPIRFSEKAEIICNHCYWKKKSKIYRIKAFFEKTAVFTDDEKTIVIIKDLLKKVTK